MHRHSPALSGFALALAAMLTAACSTPCDRASRHIQRCLSSLCEASDESDHVLCGEPDDEPLPACEGDAERFAHEFLEMSCEEISLMMRFDELAGTLPGPVRTPPADGQGPCATDVFEWDHTERGRYVYSYTDTPGGACQGLPRFGGGCPTLEDFYNPAPNGGFEDLRARSEVHSYNDDGFLTSSERFDASWEAYQRSTHRYYPNLGVWRTEIEFVGDDDSPEILSFSAPPRAEDITPPILVHNEDGTLHSYQEGEHSDRYVFIYDCSEP